MALTIRAELFQPGLQIVQPELFNQLTTLHGLIMVFGAFMPAFVGFANWQIPLMIGAPDMAFPRLNNFSFWLLPPAAILLVGSLFAPGGATAAGWTLYPPLSVQMGPGMDMAIFAIHILGVSSIIGSINIITTILNMRAPGMTLMKMPMFVWTWLVTAYMIILVMPVLAGAVTMLLTDRHFGTHFFNAAGGGDPVTVPAHLLVLRPPGGLHPHPAGVRHHLAGHSDFRPQASVRLSLDGVRDVCAIAIISVSRVGAPHVHGRDAGRRAAVLHVRVALSSRCRPASRCSTGPRRCGGARSPSRRRCCSPSASSSFSSWAGVTGVILAIAPVDIQMQDTYYVVAHFHYVMVAGSLFAMFAGTYYWLPKWTGHMYDETLGRWHFWLSMIFFNITFFADALSRARRHAAPHSRLSRCSSRIST